MHKLVDGQAKYSQIDSVDLGDGPLRCVLGDKWIDGV